ncbi:MAG: PQQ-like beta-propeller repeat protein [Planctomycetaceae bacterium]|nr:PQQ-like beta-propeller repeat protein [Planctomycetales bacterium]MCB9925739.1 PQQ-like beta-propeller repeat protein [Planctomycetaceae bacterium]
MKFRRTERMLPHQLFLTSLLAICALALHQTYCKAGDWPQILGPSRNGEAQDEPEIPKWPSAGPSQKWSYTLGQGYAGPAVVGNQIVVFHRVGGTERIESLDATTGKPVWKADFEATYGGGVNSDLGPRCVPLIHNGRVYAFGAAGDLHCVSLKDGTELWSRATYQDFDGQEGYFGAGSTPIVAAGKVIVNVGGRNAGIVAFDLETGKTEWQATDEDASYSSPTFAMVNGQSHLVFVTRLHAVSVDPESGNVRFRFRFGSRGPTVNGATPLIFDDYLFVSSSYGVGANLSRITEDGIEELWANDNVMSSQYSTCVCRDGFLFGTHGREDYANGVLRCFEAKSGAIQWTVEGFGVAHAILVGKQLLLLGVDGKLRLAEVNTQAYREIAFAQISTNTTRSLPALSNGMFLFRDNQGQGGNLVCLQLAE